MHCWEFGVTQSTIMLNEMLVSKICIENNFEINNLFKYLLQVIPEEYHYIFVDRNQNSLILKDEDTFQDYSCDINFREENGLQICVGRGWYDYIRVNKLNEGDTLLFVISDGHPESIHVTVVDRINDSLYNIFKNIKRSHNEMCHYWNMLNDDKGTRN
jgi:hypothetical protein